MRFLVWATGLLPGLGLTGPDCRDSFDLLSNYLLAGRYYGLEALYQRGERQRFCLEHVRWFANECLCTTAVCVIRCGEKDAIREEEEIGESVWVGNPPEI